jgi:ceramide glucosyltransferase
MIHAPLAVWIACLSLWLLSFLYTLVAAARTLAFHPSPVEGRGELASISVLKPLCGLEPELEENLASFCEQDYEGYQVIFTVRDESDAAVEVARRVIASHPSCDASIVTGGGERLRNPKIENVSAAMPLVRGKIVVIADSDVCVDRSYLRAVAAAFSDRSVGAATAIYGARSSGGLVADLGAMFVNDQFTPSVLVAMLVQPLRFTLGATMAVRGSVLTEIGGIEPIGATIADDYMLGHLVAAKGYRVGLAGTVPLTLVSERNLRDLFAREVRWARTVRSVRPVGYAGTILTFPLLFGALTLIFLPSAASGALFLAASLAARFALDLGTHRVLRVPGRARPWLVPLREALSLIVWGVGLFGESARWRRRNLTIGRDGS